MISICSHSSNVAIWNVVVLHPPHIIALNERRNQWCFSLFSIACSLYQPNTMYSQWETKWHKPQKLNKIAKNLECTTCGREYSSIYFFMDFVPYCLTALHSSIMWEIPIQYQQRALTLMEPQLPLILSLQQDPTWSYTQSLGCITTKSKNVRNKYLVW